MQKKNYLNNKDILLEIHRSKSSFSSFSSPDYVDYDLILDSINDIDEEALITARKNKAKCLSVVEFENAKLTQKRVKLQEFEIDPDSIKPSEVVFRIMTYDHIPNAPGRKKNPKSIADSKVKLNFPPFQHWKMDEYGNLECVGKSHWKGDVHSGKFCKDKGQTTNKLALMWLKLVERYATRSNVRGYTYNDEMRGQAILQLAQIGLQFDESKSNNPFAYYTQTIKNSFVRVINIEKRNQNIRDDILESHGLAPSYTRLHNAEWESQVKDE